MPTLAIFGAGPALGLSTARRFAQEGYDVTLVARNPTTLAQLAAELPGAQTETAELTDRQQVARALAAIEERSGTPDVVLYSPGDVGRLPVGIADLDAETLATWLPLNLFTPLDLIRAVAPKMAARGSGAILVAQGIAVREPVPAIVSSSVGQAALLNYLHALAADLRDDGVRVGSLQIARLIERSAAAALLATGHFDGVDVGPISRVDPDQLAELLWTMATEDGELERVA